MDAVLIDGPINNIHFMGSMNKEIRTPIKIGMFEQDIKQKDLVEALGVSQRAISRILRGQSEKVNDLLKSILDYVGLRIMVEPINDE